MTTAGNASKEANDIKENTKKRIISAADKSHDLNMTDNVNDYFLTDGGDITVEELENGSEERKLNKKQELIRDCSYFEENPKQVSMYNGDNELMESPGLPPGWIQGIKILTSGRKIPSFISPDRVLSFRSKVSVFEYIKFEGKYSEEELKDLAETMKLKKNLT